MPTTQPKLPSTGLRRGRRPFDARELALDQRGLTLAETGPDPLDEHLDATAVLAAEVIEVHGE
jgi:hypothetical protein